MHHPFASARPSRSILKSSILALGAFSAFLAPNSAWAAILTTYTFGPNGSTPAVLGPTTVAPNVAATSITADAGLALDLSNQGTPPSSPYLRTTQNGAVANNEAASFAGNYDFRFSLTANTGFFLNLSTLTLDAWRGGTSTNRGFFVRSSLDSFATSLLVVPNIDTVRGTPTAYSIDFTTLPNPSIYQNIGAGTTVIFKFFTTTVATGSSVEFDNITVNGTVGTVPFAGYTWTGTANNLWNTTDANWSGTGTVYADGLPTSDVAFSDGPATTAISIPSAVNPRLLVLNSNGPYSFSGSTITATSVIKSGIGTTTINNSLTSPTISVGGGTLAIASGGTVSSPSLNVVSGGTLTVDAAGTLDPASKLIVSGNAILNGVSQNLAELSGDSAGVLTLNNNNVLRVTGTSTYLGKISGSGSVVKDNPGILTLGGTASDFTGGLSVVGPGSVVLAGAKPGGTLPVTASANGKLVLGSPVAVTSNIVLNSPASLGATGAAQNLNGTLTLNGPVSLASFNVAAGSGNADLQLNGLLIAPTNPPITILQNNGNAPESAAVRFRGPASTYAGTITMGSAGKIELQNTTATGSPIGTATVVIVAGTINAAQAGTYSLINLRNNFVSVPPGTPTTTTFGNNVQVTGTGTIIMNLLGNAVAGSTTVLGDLQIGNSQTVAAASTASPVSTVQFNSVHLTGGNTTFTPGFVAGVNGSYVIQDHISLGPVSENVAGSSLTMNGAASLTFTGVNTYTGPTSLQSGTTILASGASISQSSSVTVAPGATLNTSANPAFVVPVSQTLTVNGTLTGAVSLSGTLLGSGIVNGALTALSGSLVSPGNSAGVLTTNNVNLLAGSTLQMELSKAISGSLPLPGFDYDVLSVTDTTGGVTPTVQLGATLGLTVGFGIEQGDIFTIINNNGFDTVVGTFAGLPNGAVFQSGGQSFQISYGDESGTQAFELSAGNDVSLLAVPEPGSALLLLSGLAVFTARRRRA